MIALDTSALLAYLFTASGCEAVAEHMDARCLSSVNLAEVISRFVRNGHSPELVHPQLLSSGIEMVPFLSEDAALAAGLVLHTQKFALPLRDRACLALALWRNIPAVTANHVWSTLDLPIAIQLIGATAR